MNYTILLWVMVIGSVCRRYIVPFVLATLLMSLAVGGGALYGGGTFWKAAGFGAMAALGAAVVYVLFATALAIKNGFK